MKTNLTCFHESNFRMVSRSWPNSWCSGLILVAMLLALSLHSASANQPGGGNGTGANVTVVNNNNGTVTVSNGIASITIDTAYARLSSIKYTYNNNGTTQTTETLGGTTNNTPGREDFSFGGSPLGNVNGGCVYSLATDPASNGGARADIELLSTTASNGIFEAHFVMLKGSPGFYVSAINTRRSTDTVTSFGVFGINADASPPFNWLSDDAARNYFTGAQYSSSQASSVVGASHEMVTVLNGGLAGQYNDKFFGTQDRANEKAFGWSSVGTGGLNIGIWTMANMEYGDGGPLKPDVTAAPNTEMSNPMMTGEFSMGGDGTFASNESWTKTAGPYFVYLNNVSSSITDPNQAAQALYNDALAQYTAEQGAWPYSWFTNSGYVQASGRGTVTGQIVVYDPLGNHNPAVSGTWVGLEAQPNTSTDTYDFQQWLKSYQFWTQTDSGGNFTFKNVLPGSNYTLYAYGPGIAGTFISQHQNKMPGPGTEDPPLELDFPSPTFAVSVTAGQTTKLGTFDWTANRVGPTVFEIGYPDRKADKFRHGEDYWAYQTSPKVGYPTGIWGGQMYFNSEYPDDTVNYTVGQSRWQTDWNYVLPSQLISDIPGSYADAAGVISFNLAATPGADDKASLYLGCASDDGGKVIVMVNSTALDSSTDGVTATPNPISATNGFDPTYQDDTSVHCNDNGPFSDERITFPASLLHSGTNTITIMNASEAYAGQLMTDYIRLEMTNYLPPPPASVHAYPGNNRVLVTWPVVPGATRYALLRSTAQDSGYTPLAGAGGVLGTVCGSGPSLMTYTDESATNGPNYYYEVESLNTQGSSAASGRSGRATPLSTNDTTTPAAPTDLTAAAGNHSVSLHWSAGLDVNYCNVYRSTLHSNGVGGTYSLRTILIQDGIPGDNGSFSCTDSTPTNGTAYSYYVVAVSPNGTSGSSATVTATPMPPAPANAPAGLTSSRSGTTITLKWTLVENATGYTVYRSTTSGGPFTLSTAFIASTPLADYPDSATVAGTTYYYQVTAINAAGISSPASITVGP
jgi:rhamnogalacturonan endolyase